MMLNKDIYLEKNKSSNSMRLRVLHLNAESGWRGGEQQLAYLVQELSRAGVISYIGLKKNSPLQHYCVKQGIPFFVFGFRKGPDPVTPFQLKKICRLHSINLVHIHTSGAHNAAVLAAALGNTPPLVLSRRVAVIPKSFWYTRWKYNHPAILKILCVSDTITRLMQGYVTHPEKCKTIHSGIDLTRFSGRDRSAVRKEFNIPDHVRVIGSVASLEAGKDIFTFIDTLAELIRQGLLLKGVIVGDGSLRVTLEQYAHEKKIFDHIVFTGYRDDVPVLLAGFDLLLMTSVSEGLGTSILDAFASGVPVVGTATGGIPEIVVHEETGMLAPVKDPLTLAAHTKRLLTDASLRAKVIAGARLMVEKFTKERMARLTLEVYEAIVHTPPATKQQ